MRTEKGDIILIPFPFTNLEGKKLRPSLILFNGESDVTVAFITSQLKWREPYDVLLKRDAINGFREDSLLVIHKISTINKELIEGYIGCVEPATLIEIDQNLISVFKIQISK
ncbi:MAG: type II toxin-antitoxin system PemK/MazF family toxin [Chitinophagales bacterium]|nr:type II toxin-antitoxin system PemK/MazF family toxin [Chitinophagales bacterium]